MLEMNGSSISMYIRNALSTDAITSNTFSQQ